MKIILAIVCYTFAACGLLVGCSPMVESVDRVSEELATYSVDFSKYTDSGFHIDESGYSKKYKPVAIVSASVFPSARRKDLAEGMYGDNPTSVTNYMWLVDAIKIQAAFDSLYKKSVRMGADAIVNLRIETEVRNYNQLYGSHLPLRGYLITGYAIKRLE